MATTEFFVWSNSFAAPFFSDEGNGYVEAETAEAALAKARAEYKHPAGLFAMNVYRSADDYMKRNGALAQYLHPLAAAQKNGIKCAECGEKSRLSSTMPDGEMRFYCDNSHVTEKHRREFM